MNLFFTFAQIGLFSFGGGYAILPMIQKVIIEENGWISADVFADLLAMSQVTPGPISLNAATFIGLKLEGPAGAVTATLGLITTSVIICLILAKLYSRYGTMPAADALFAALKPAAAALVAAAAIPLIDEAVTGQTLIKGTVSVIIMAAAFFILRKAKPNPAAVIVVCGILGGTLTLFV
jgi:chromate transporter